jgi:nicotinamidase-related amidase
MATEKVSALNKGITRENIMAQKREETIAIYPSKTALLLLHWQNDLADTSGKLAGKIPLRLAANHTVEHALTVLKASRKKGMLVVYVNASHRPGYPEVSPRLSSAGSHIAKTGCLIRGSWGAEVIQKLKPLTDDIVINNYSFNAFADTELDLILRNKGITDLVLSGLVTNWIVESTARDAACKGYNIYPLTDCCQSFTDEMHNWSLTNILSAIGKVIDSKTYITGLQKIPVIK